jgi:hypothetical protein
MTDTVFFELQKRNVTLQTTKPLKPKTLSEFISIFNTHSSFSSLLLVTHGSPWIDEDKGAYLSICGENYPWAFTAHMELHIEDKLIALAICHGLNPTSGDSLIKSQNQALMVVGPNDVLFKHEVLGFFPPFFGDLFAQGHCDWQKEFVQRKLGDHNSKSGDKMILRSFV